MVIYRGNKSGGCLKVDLLEAHFICGCTMYMQKMPVFFAVTRGIIILVSIFYSRIISLKILF